MSESGIAEYELVEKAAAYIAERTGRRADLALILGSGLGAWADTISDAVAVPYDEIPGFHMSSVAGHAGRLVLGRAGTVDVVAMQGRVHAYEGVSAAQVVRPLRTMWKLGAGTAIVTNASGGLDPQLAPGSLVLIRDHINLSGNTPLTGPNDERFGARFPDMTHTWTPELRAVARRAAARINVAVHEGVYAGVAGPSYETPAEVQMLRRAGGDLVGMSTVLEAIAASHLRMRLLGISCVTNHAAGIVDEALNHEDVQRVAAEARGNFQRLIDAIIEELGTT